MKSYFQAIFHDFIPGFDITVLLALIYVLNLLWIVSYGVKLPAPSAFLSVYVAIYLSLLILLNLISSLVARFLMLTAQCFNGKGSFAQTRYAVLYAFVALLPVNVLSCVLQFIFHQPNSHEWMPLKFLVCRAILFLFAISFGLLVRNVALYYKINRVYALICVLISGGIVILIAQFLWWLGNTLGYV